MVEHLKYRTWIVGCVLGICLVNAGCTDSESVPVVPVTGTITQDGKPLEGATVTFIPTGEPAMAASGVTDKEGTYLLNTAGASDNGAVPGSYQVTVAKFLIKEVRTQEEAMEEMKKRGSMLAPPLAETRNLLPPKYLTPTQSGFTADVKADGENAFDFEIK